MYRQSSALCSSVFQVDGLKENVINPFGIKRGMDVNEIDKIRRAVFVQVFADFKAIGEKEFFQGDSNFRLCKLYKVNENGKSVQFIRKLKDVWGENT